MPDAREKVIDKLLETDEDFKQWSLEHRELDREVSDLASREFLIPKDQEHLSIALIGSLQQARGSKVRAPECELIGVSLLDGDCFCV